MKKHSECAACTTIMVDTGAVRPVCQICTEKVCVNCFHGEHGCAVCNPDYKTNNTQSNGET